MGDKLGITLDTYELSVVLNNDNYDHYLETKEAENWYELSELFSFTRKEWEKIMLCTEHVK